MCGRALFYWQQLFHGIWPYCSTKASVPKFGNFLIENIEKLRLVCHYLPEKYHADYIDATAF